MEAWDTVSQAITALRGAGYVEDFNLTPDCLECRSGQIKLFANYFQVDQFFRFEGDSDPADESIVYAISSKDKKLKGVLVNAFGVYGDTVSNEIAEKLTVR